MDLSSLKPKVKNKRGKRVGRGPGSGRGKTSGRGHKGAGQRAGKKLPYTGFRGGNLPLLRVIPKRGFNPPRKKVYQVVNLSDIQKKISKSEEINPEILEKFNLIRSKSHPVKILAKNAEDFKLRCTVKADKFSAKAKIRIEEAGGKTECLAR